MSRTQYLEMGLAMLPFAIIVGMAAVDVGWRFMLTAIAACLAVSGCIVWLMGNLP